MKHCLIVIDMQTGIFGLKQPVFKKDELIRNVKTALRFARDNGVGIIFTRHENNTFLKPGTEAYQIVNDLGVLPGDTVIAKKHPGVFQEPILTTF